MKRLTAGELGRVDATTAPFVTSLVLESAAGTRDFECSEVLRALPGRRLVIRTALNGEPVVVKLFLGRGRERYLERERRGLGWLAAAGAPSAEVLDRVHGHHVDGLVLGYLPEARVVSAGDQKALEAIARLLGRMHDNGTHHRDLHLDNFVTTATGVHAIDGDGVRRWNGGIVRRWNAGTVQPAKGAMPLGPGLDELAVLAAQRPPSEDVTALDLERAYLEERAMNTTPEPDFDRRLAKARRVRLERYATKTQRNCSEYSVTGSFRSHTLCVRGRGEACLSKLTDPDAVFAEGEILKAGNSATVVRVDGPTAFVVKRFNIKSPAHGVRRMLRIMPRYRRAWVFGQLLNFLEIPTARPLALLERRYGPLRGVAYLAQEDLSGEHLAAEVDEHGLTEARCEELTRLFCLLRRSGLSHGDTKATNFVVHQDRLHLIDLDAMRLDPKGNGADLARFLDNWPAPIAARFRASFVKAGLL